MNPNDPLLTQLRAELDAAKTKLKHYKAAYRNERNERQRAENYARDLQQMLGDLNDERRNLQTELYDCREHINSFNVPKPSKRWQDLISSISKAKRKAQYRKCIDQSIVHLHEAQRIRVQMKVGEQEVFIVWSEDDLQTLRNQAINVVRPLPPEFFRRNHQIQNNGNNSDDDNNEQDKEDQDAFLSNGSWNPVHLKKIISVMDEFKISQEAYHELRLSSKSILPPINQILSAKKKMSHTIQMHASQNGNSFMILTCLADFCLSNGIR